MILIDGLVVEVRRRLAARPSQEVSAATLDVVRGLNTAELLGVLFSAPVLIESTIQGATLRDTICAVLADRVVRRYAERD